MALGDLWTKVRCKIAHDGTWAYLDTRSCRQVLTCGRCGGTFERQHHEYGPAAHSPTPAEPCRYTQTCRRDGTVSAFVKHDHGSPQYVAEGRCEQTRRCRRAGCDDSVAAPVIHPSFEWRYLEDPPKGSSVDSSKEWCRQGLFCSRCGDQEGRGRSRIEHDWSGPWVDAPEGADYAASRRCARDGARQTTQAR